MKSGEAPFEVLSSTVQLRFELQPAALVHEVDAASAGIFNHYNIRLQRTCSTVRRLPLEETDFTKYETLINKRCGMSPLDEFETVVYFIQTPSPAHNESCPAVAATRTSFAMVERMMFPNPGPTDGCGLVYTVNVRPGRRSEDDHGRLKCLLSCIDS